MTKPKDSRQASTASAPPKAETALADPAKGLAPAENKPATTPEATPKPPEEGEKPPSEAQVLQLFLKNLDEIRRWYRNASVPGREMGHIVLSERLLSHVTKALELALKGKSWSAPAHLP